MSANALVLTLVETSGPASAEDREIPCAEGAERRWAITLGGDRAAVAVGSVAVRFAGAAGRRGGWLSYQVEPDWQGRGLATAAAAEAVRIAFASLGCQRLQAHCPRENLASQRVLAKLGFWRSGEVAQFHAGAWRQELLFLLERRWWRG